MWTGSPDHAADTPVHRPGQPHRQRPLPASGIRPYRGLRRIRVFLRRTTRRVRGWPGEGVAAEEVDVVVVERGQAGEQFVGDGEAVGGQLLEGGVDVKAVEQDNGVAGRPEGAELVLSELGMLTAWGRLSADRSLRAAPDFLEDRRPSRRVAGPVLAKVPDEDVTGALENAPHGRCLHAPSASD